MRVLRVGRSGGLEHQRGSAIVDRRIAVKEHWPAAQASRSCSAQHDGAVGCRPSRDRRERRGAAAALRMRSSDRPKSQQLGRAGEAAALVLATQEFVANGGRRPSGRRARVLHRRGGAAVSVSVGVAVAFRKAATAVDIRAALGFAAKQVGPAGALGPTSAPGRSFKRQQRQQQHHHSLTGTERLVSRDSRRFRARWDRPGRAAGKRPSDC